MLQTSYLWFILVPLLVKLVNKISSTELNFGERRFNLGVQLPFSWELFFYSAVVASVAHLIYSWKCPAIIKRYSTYSDFKDQGQGSDQVRKEFESLLLRHTNKVKPAQLQKNIKEYLRSFCVESSAGHNPDDIAKKPFLALQYVSSSEIKADKISDAFWFVRDFAERLNRNYLIACFWLYVIALLLIAFVFMQNIWFVVRYSINTHVN